MFHDWIVLPPDKLNAFEVGDGPFVGDVPGVQSGLRLDQNEMDFVVGQGAMFDAARNDDKFAFTDNFGAITELHLQRALGYQKKFVFLVMMMPHELTFEFNDLHVAIVDFSEDARTGEVGKERELVA
jgi:hypothetical protein